MGRYDFSFNHLPELDDPKQTDKLCTVSTTNGISPYKLCQELKGVATRPTNLEKML